MRKTLWKEKIIKISFVDKKMYFLFLVFFHNYVENSTFSKKNGILFDKQRIYLYNYLSKAKKSIREVSYEKNFSTK